MYFPHKILKIKKQKFESILEFFLMIWSEMHFVGFLRPFGAFIMSQTWNKKLMSKKRYKKVRFEIAFWNSAFLNCRKYKQKFKKHLQKIVTVILIDQSQKFVPVREFVSVKEPGLWYFLI